MTEIVVRFAPSPTGFLHIGSARTALDVQATIGGNGSTGPADMHAH